MEEPDAPCLEHAVVLETTTVGTDGLLRHDLQVTQKQFCPQCQEAKAKPDAKAADAKKLTAERDLWRRRANGLRRQLAELQRVDPEQVAEGW